MGSVMDLVRRLSPKGWAMVGGAFAAAVVFIVLVMHFASSPSYSTLETGIDPSQTSKITSTLSTQGIPYQLQNGGTAIAVESGKTDQARVALASAGLLTGSSQPGFSLLDKQSLGQSNFQQQVTYERALEGQLASTIETIDGVSSAQVNLVIPDSQDQLFSDQSQAATASVLLSGSSSLQSGSVRGIANLVASSVPGLSVNKVTITGSNGAELWPSNSAANSGGGLPAEEAAEQKYDSSMSTEVEAMLAQTLGVGKAQVVVNATLNDNRATQESLVYGKKGTALNANTSNETLKGNGSAASGTAGATSNIPAYSSSNGSGGTSNYKNQSDHTQYGVDKTITHSVIAPGAIQRQSVSVLVNSSVPASELKTIKGAVANAVGLNTKRGDQISVSQLKFAPASTTTVKPTKANPMMKYAKYGLLGIGALVFLFFMMRAIKKREKDSFSQPRWLSELESPRPLAALEASTPTEVSSLQPHIGVARRQIEDLVQRDPDLVAQHLRAWMAED
jgi:flagellar M-ring protein FliF